MFGPKVISLTEFTGITGSGLSFNSSAAINNGKDISLLSDNYRLRIDTPAELIRLSELANSSNMVERQYYLSSSILLGNFINLDGVVGEFLPMGSLEFPFVGKFDGQGLEIKNFNLVKTIRNQARGEIGLFGYVGTAGIITNFGMIDPKISYTGAVKIGGIARNKCRNNKKCICTNGKHI